MSNGPAMAATLPLLNFELGKLLYFRLAIMSMRISRRLAQSYREHFELSAPEWRTIVVLGQQGPMSSIAVIAATAMDKGRLSRAVTRLSNAHLITREADPRDRRYAILGLTATGHNIYRQIVPLVQDIDAEMVAGFSAPEREVLDGALAKMEACLELSIDGRRHIAK